MYLHRLATATTLAVSNVENGHHAPVTAPIRRSLVLLLLMMGAFAEGVLAQTTYYVAANGSDSNDGHSADRPFLSLARVNTLPLQPGDQVLLRRGDTFRGGLLIRQSGSAAQSIVFDAYGAGAKPVLSGSEPLTNWTNLGNNRWQATCSACSDRVTGLYRNNSALPLGRYPNFSDANKGYLTVQSHVGKTQLTSQQSLSTNWTGGEAVYRPVPWILNRAMITGQTGNTLNVAGSGNYDISDNWGYFIQNHPATLDQPGEWYYNPADKTVLLYDNQNNPNDQPLTATVAAEAVTLSGASFVSIRNLHITQALATGLLVENGSNLIIADNEVTQSGEDGISFRGNGSQVVLENNLIDDINNNGVGISAYQNITVRGNTIRRIGLVPGRGKSGDGTYVGFQSASTANTLIENNVFDNIGYNALNFSTNTTIQRNQISNFCLTKSDGAGIYIWNGNRQPMRDIRILSNIVYNGIGAPEGAPAGTYSGANGIYLDDCTTNMEVSGNSVHNCRGSGVYLHGSSNIRLTGNTAYNNSEGQLAIISANGCQPRDNLIQGNSFVSRLANQFSVKYESNEDDLVNYGQFDNNVYARPFEDTRKILAVYNRTTGAALTLAEWQNRYGKDLTSANSPVTYASGNPDDYIKFAVNPTANASQVPLEGRYRDLRNNLRTDQITLPPFSSVVLLKEIAQPPVSLREPENPANAVAGLDYQYYEGHWNQVPDFNTLTPLKTGSLPAPSLAVRNRNDHFAIRYQGYLRVPTDGVYTFYTNSDDGTKLSIGATEVVNNDGPHPEQERSGSIGLKAGVHALTVGYFQKDGGRALGVSYAGPNLNKRAVPDGSYQRVPTEQPPAQTSTGTLREPENPANAVAGLAYQYYEGTWDNLPDFGSLTPVKTGTAGGPDLGVRNRNDNFALVYKGFVSVPTDGVYTFFTASDDGSKLLIGSTEVVNNDGLHPVVEKGGTIGLKAGVHALTILYLQRGGGQALTLSYAGPGLDKQIIPNGKYQWVSTNQSAPPPPTTALREPENPASTVAGLDYQYYEGHWNQVPDFSALSPLKTGTLPAPSLAVRNRNDHFAIRYQGYLRVPTDGVYTFFTNSDDGTKLWIGSTEVVNNDGPHPEQERSGSIGLKAGVHALTVGYFQRDGGQALTLSYAGPNLSKQVIPTAAFVRTFVENTGGETGTGTGLRAEYYNNRDLAAPVVLSRTDATVDFNWGDGSPAPGTINADNFSVRWRGQVEAPVTGNYTFSTLSDDGVRLWVDGTLLINNWTGHAPTTDTGPPLALVAGQRYDIRMEYFEGPVGAVAKLQWAYPAQAQQIVPQQRLYPAGGSGRVAAVGASALDSEVAVQVYPVPARDEIRVRYHADLAGDVLVQLVNTTARAAFRETYSVVRGENLLRVPVQDLARGMYIITLIQGHQRTMRKVLLTE